MASVVFEGAEVGGATKIVRVSCAFSPRVAEDPNPALGATPSGHMRSGPIASAVKSNERT